MADKTYSFQGSSFSDQCCKQSTRRVPLYINLIGINVIIIIIIIISKMINTIQQLWVGFSSVNKIFVCPLCDLWVVVVKHSVCVVLELI